MSLESGIKISVVMPVYNREGYLREAIESILIQTFTHFEFIIINDGSTDKTEEIILDFQQKDNRIKYYNNEQNLGNNATRNKGMQLAKGKYIAIMDSDDISVPDRLEIQFNYLEKNPQIGILGGFKIFFDENGYFLQHYPTDPDYIKAFLFFKNAVGQPTVMLRREIIHKNQLFYLPDLENMGDYNLWYRASRQGLIIKNLPKVLLYYRLSPSQIGIRKLDDRKQKLKKFFRERLTQFGYLPEENDFDLLHDFIRGKIEVNNANFKKLKFLLQTIEQRNIENRFFDIDSFKAALFYFRLRLLKYHFLQFKNNKAAFATQIMKLLLHTGFISLKIFWENEGKFIKKSGRKTYKKHNGCPPFLTSGTAK